jgi:zinc transport system substrate-binding protein
VSVVAGLYPYAFAAQVVGGDLVSVTNLTQPGAEPHDLELSARQVMAIARADLTVYQPGMQPAVDQAVREAPARRALPVSTVVAERDLGAGPDPHLWLDPTQLIPIAAAIADQLVQIDPAHRQTYQDHLAGLRADLTQLDQAYAAGLADCQRRDFVTTHDAFGYLAERYSLTQIALTALSPDAEPSPRRITEIHQIARATGLTTVFFETLVSPELAQAIAGDLGLRTDQLDPVEGITDQSRGADYLGVMAANLTALRQANGCS